MKSAKRGLKRDQTHKRMTRGWYDAHYTLSQCHVRHSQTCVRTRENVTYEGVLFTLHRRLQQIAISCNLATTFFKKIYELHQFSFHCHHEVLEEEDECHLWY